MARGIGRATALAVAFVVASHVTHLRAQDAAVTPLAAERAAASASDGAGLASALTKALHADAALVWPGAPVAAGPDAPRLLAAQQALDSLRLNWQPLGLELSRDSSLAVTWGVAVVTPRATPGPPRFGRYIHAWRRDGEEWRIAALLLSGVFPPSGTVVPSGMPRRRAPLPATGAAGPFAAADLAFAKLAGDSGASVAFTHWAAPGVVMVDGAGMLVRGPEAVGALVSGPADWSWHPVAAGAATSGDLAWTVGEATITPEGAAPIYSKYLTIWRRLPDGSIRFLTDGGNARPAP